MTVATATVDLDVIRVASVPSDHVYVRHLAPPTGMGGVVRLQDPTPAGAPPAGAPWYPPSILDPGWVSRHASTFDVMHLHFGFDAKSPRELEEFLAELRQHHKPFVFTVHDLRNPHHRDESVHDAQLDVLVPAADALITLTEGAADVIMRRWGRAATVLPHPHVVPKEILCRERRNRRDGTFVAGVHLKSLRAGMEPLPVIETLREAVRGLAGARLRIDVHCDVMTPGSTRHAPEVAALVRDAARDAHVEVIVHDFFSDTDLWSYLEGLDVSILPYRFGTHSGWLEACHDLGTRVIAPDCGFYADQRPCLVYALNAGEYDAASLVDAVRRAHAENAPRRPGLHRRLDERRLLAARHREIYLDAMTNAALSCHR